MLERAMTSPFDHACPLCGAPASISTKAAGRTFVHCGVCDLIHVPAAQHLAPIAERARYLRHQNRIDDAGYVETVEGVLGMLAKHARPAGRVLDFGSGPTPVLVELLRRRGYDAVGYDPHFGGGDWPDGVFDAIVSVETFEHLREPAVELSRIRDALAEGAPLVVKTLFHGGIDTLADWYYVRDTTHVAFYSGATFSWIAKAFDLRLVRHDGVSLACLCADS